MKTKMISIRKITIIRITILAKEDAQILPIVIISLETNLRPEVAHQSVETTKVMMTRVRMKTVTRKRTLSLQISI